jgi:septum formation protein
MRSFSPAERDQVLDLEGEAALKSVGGYRLEGASIRLFEKIEGDYFAILGLPLLELIAALRQHAPQTLDPASASARSSSATRLNIRARRSFTAIG